MKSIYLKICLVFLFVLTLIGFQCGGDGTISGGNSSSDPDGRHILIEKVDPSFLSSTLHTYFDVTFKGYDIYDTAMVHVEIMSQASSSCIAFGDSSRTIDMSITSGVVRIYTDSLLSGCVPQNSIFRIKTWFLDTLNRVNADSVYYQWGNPSSLGGYSVNVERYRMQYVPAIVAETLSNSIKLSFDPPDSNYMNLDVDLGTQYGGATDSDFAVTNLTDLITCCNDYSTTHDNNGVVHNKIFYAKGQYWRLGRVGQSQNTSPYPPNGTDNWSFVWLKNIDSIRTNAGSINDTTEAKLTCIHELLHQLGSIDDSGHTFHTGYFYNRCALWYDNPPPNLIHFAYELLNHRKASIFKICMQHCLQLRTFRGIVPFDNTFGNTIFTHNENVVLPMSGGIEYDNDKYKMTMTLLKSEYKKYEPILATLNLINNDSKPMKIYNLFEHFSPEPNFYIINTDNNKIYTRNNQSLSFISNVRAKIQSGDTLIFSMPINNWGEKTSYPKSLTFEDVYFDQFGYLPPGNYKAYFYFDENMQQLYGTSLMSNEVTFKVNELTEEDTKILKLYKEKKYDEVINIFPDNSFTEHVLAWKLLPYWLKTTENTENDYNQFFSKYPNSSYTLSWSFMLPYVIAAEKEKGTYKAGLEYLLNSQNSSEKVKKVLKNKGFTSIIKSYGRELEDNE